MAGFDLCIGDGAVGLNLDEQHYFAAYVHAVGEFGINGWNAADDGAMDVAREGHAGAKSESANADERTCSAR